jgi:hypothetical protein
MRKKQTAKRPEKKMPDFAKRFAVTADDLRAVKADHPRKTLRELLEEDRGE